MNKKEYKAFFNAFKDYVPRYMFPSSDKKMIPVSDWIKCLKYSLDSGESERDDLRDTIRSLQIEIKALKGIRAENEQRKTVVKRLAFMNRKLYEISKELCEEVGK